MTPEQKTQRKRVLNDPVACYIQHNSDADKELLSSLEQSVLEYAQLKQQQKNLQQQTQKISREIGAARKAKQSIDELKSSMQEKSAEGKRLTGLRQDIETKIFDYFDNEQNTLGKSDIDDRRKDVGTSPADGRQYKDINYNLDKVTISILTEATRKQWDQYVEHHPDASIYHRHAWGELIKNTFGHEHFYYCAFDDRNHIIGILPLIRLSSRLFGDFLVSMPYFNYGGALADHPKIEHLLMQTANAKAASLGVKHVEYRDDISRSDYPARTDKVNMILALPHNRDELWESFTPKLRAQIKRPQRENPESIIGGIELLNDFYQVFAKNMRDLGTPVYSRSLFANIISQFNQHSHIVILRLNDKPVAAAFLIGYHNTLEIPWASTLRSVSHLSINMLMYWNILCFAIEREYRFFDFGRSSKDSGTYRFKKQWNAKPKQLHWHYWLPEGETLPALNPSNPKFALMITIWKRLPLFITKLIGPGIVKNLP